ncbi:60S ribosomal protein L29 [Pipistrellus kuhlii]|uniref:60S ribosomal protein L29 n=1 Tax=Pipistrellus kuhlii TaxID=59472 RepID=A0A7J8B4M4_PIPKU|nr:60S ribosomal protein L29 [Pipistrellus kuhlii]KAF6393562.1 hypothetical protein mPipKuh1_015114 [Pipistrellus kuhlii]
MANPQEANKKGLKKEQANNAKAMSACAEAIKALVKPKEVKPGIPKNSSHKFNQVAHISHPTLGKSVCAHIKGSQALPAKVQGSNQIQTAAVAVSTALTPAQDQAPKGAQTPSKAPEERPLSDDVRTELV